MYSSLPTPTDTTLSQRPSCGGSGVLEHAHERRATPMAQNASTCIMYSYDETLPSDSSVAYLGRTANYLASLLVQHQEKRKHRLSFLDESQRSHLRYKLQQWRTQLLERRSKLLQQDPSTIRAILTDLISRINSHQLMKKNAMALSSARRDKDSRMSQTTHDPALNFSASHPITTRNASPPYPNDSHYPFPPSLELPKKKRCMEFNFDEESTFASASRKIQRPRPHESFPLTSSTAVPFRFVKASKSKDQFGALPSMMTRPPQPTSVPRQPLSTQDMTQEPGEKGSSSAASHRLSSQDVICPNDTEDNTSPALDPHTRATGRRDVTVNYPNCVESIMWRVSVGSLLWDTERFISEQPAQGISLWWRDCHKNNIASDERDSQGKTPASTSQRHHEGSGGLSEHHGPTQGRLSPYLCQPLPKTFLFLSHHYRKETNKTLGETEKSANDSPYYYSPMPHHLPLWNQDNQPVTHKRSRHFPLHSMKVSNSPKRVTRDSKTTDPPSHSHTRHLNASQSSDRSFLRSSLNDGLSTDFDTWEPQDSTGSDPEDTHQGCPSSAPFLRKSKQERFDPLEKQRKMDFDFVKKKTGWHPYVWYLMCRRPELYSIGIRARGVVKVAGWEWETVQKEPDVLQNFLERITEFLRHHPVPKGMTKLEAKKYKRLAANSVRTPWQNIRTPAVMRAL